MDLNNMKVTDLKKELKSRGLSIVGNKSELMARLESILSSQESQTIDDNEDSVLNEEEDEILGSDLLDGGSEGDPKADEALIEDDFLDNSLNGNNLLTTNKPKTTIKRVTAAAAMTSVSDNTKSSDNSNDDKSKSTTATHLLKTSNAITLTVNEKKEMRAQKFGDNKLSVRAERFGLSSNSGSTEAKPLSTSDSTNANEKLKKRAERFGGNVSDTLKKSDDKEKLLKRKERFGAITAANTTNSPNTNSKRAITFSVKNDEQKRQRLERFGGVS